LCSSEYDLQIAVVENSLSPNPMMEESVVRLYDVGRFRADEEDMEGEGDDIDEDEEDEGGGEEEEEQGDGENSNHGSDEGELHACICSKSRRGGGGGTPRGWRVVKQELNRSETRCD
jgi:hypothetical protein